MMLRLTLTLLCVLAVKTVVTLPVTKSGDEPALSVLPLHKTGQQEFEQQGIVQQEQQQAIEKKEHIHPEHAQVKSAEPLLEKESILLTDEKKEEKLPEIDIKEKEKKPEEKKLEEPTPLGASEEILTKAVAPQAVESVQQAVPPVQGEQILPKSSIPEVAAELPTEAKSAEPIAIDQKHEEKKEQEQKEEKKLHEEIKPAVLVHEPAPVAEIPTEKVVKEPVLDEIKAKAGVVADEGVKIDDKTDRVTREAEEAAKKQAKEAEVAAVSTKSQQDAAEVQHPEHVEEQAAVKASVSEEKAKSLDKVRAVESPVAEVAAKKPLEPVAPITAETQQSPVLSEIHETPQLKSQIVEEVIHQKAKADAPVAVEEAAQQQVVEESKAEVKEAKSAEDPLKAEALPKPEEIKEPLKLPVEEMLKEEPKEAEKEKIEVEKSSEEISGEKDSSEEDMKKKEKLPSFSRSGSESSEASSSSS